MEKFCATFGKIVERRRCPFKMSRIGNKIITVPAGVTVTVNGTEVSVKGPKGSLTKTFYEKLVIEQNGSEIVVKRPDDLPMTRAMHGTCRALLANMITGVSEGFKKGLELVGVGYRVAAKGKGVTLSLGYSHPVEIDAVAGIEFKVEGNTKLSVEGIEKEVVGQVAAVIRAKRLPEPYKGKGIKYAGEVIRRKEGKKA